MKAYLKVIGFGLLAAALALGVRYLYVESAEAMDGGSTTWYEDAMLQAREMFLEKPDAIQELTAQLVAGEPCSLLRKADDSFLCRLGAADAPMPEALEALVPAACGGYTNGGEVLNIEVTEKAVIFYTYYGSDGCAGFLYEKELDSTDYFDVVELVEEWKLFYRIPA